MIVGVLIQKALDQGVLQIGKDADGYLLFAGFFGARPLICRIDNEELEAFQGLAS